MESVQNMSDCMIPSVNYDEKIVRIFNEFRSESYEDQIKLYRNRRKDEVLKVVDKIIDGKKRKLKSRTSNKR